MNETERGLIRQLKAREITPEEIPDEYKMSPRILAAERKMGLRKIERRGYDILRKCFFVEEYFSWLPSDESSKQHQETIFQTFSDYYNFVDGKIYENACYFQYIFSQEEIKTYQIELDKINFQSLVPDKFDGGQLECQNEDEYNAKERQKTQILKWCEKFNACRTLEEFLQVRNSLPSHYQIDIYFTQFILHNREQAFDILMSYLNQLDPNDMLSLWDGAFIYVMCLFYGSQTVLDAYEPYRYSLSTQKKKKCNLKKYADELDRGQIYFSSYGFFDTDTHFYYYERRGYDSPQRKGFPCVKTSLYFNTFEELAKYLKGDLRFCDFSQAYLPNVDFKKFVIDKTTRLPLSAYRNLVVTVEKLYDRLSKCFIVRKILSDESGKEIRRQERNFDYFFDFVSYLNGDLRGADLLFCDGLENVDLSAFDIEKVILRGEIAKKLGRQILFTPYSEPQSFSVSLKNEETAAVPKLRREEKPDWDTAKRGEVIYYVSDLHLLHKIDHAKCISENDKIYVVQKLIDGLLQNAQWYSKHDIILIGGDTSSDFNLFRLFVSLLQKSCNQKNYHPIIIFILGNHELWDWGDTALSEIYAKYINLLTENGMHLLQNNLLYLYDEDDETEANYVRVGKTSVGTISEKELQELSPQTLRERVRRARTILFGGIGFSGYNESFNANAGIYRYAINRAQEIEESAKMEFLYRRVCATLPDRNVIIFTHMPLKDWSKDETLIPNYIYISGHTHRNFFYDDGEQRFYADNQIGYMQQASYLKSIFFDSTYDIFADYDDGIYEIDRNQYIAFMRGKNLTMSYMENKSKIYLVKRNKYYCFASKASKGALCILHGGKRKALPFNNIGCLYSGMLDMIKKVKTPLDTFTENQREISNFVRSFGGSGTIHGAIVDIDFFNHIFLNPLDNTVTFYYGENMKRKEVFSNINDLMSHHCLELYSSYLKSIEGREEFKFVTAYRGLPSGGAPYYEIDIYYLSNEIRKMQRLSSNILTVWYDERQ